MADTSLIQRALRRERVLVVAGLLIVIGLSWSYLLTGAGTMEDMGGMLMPMSSGPWDYVVVWAGFSVAAVALQYGLEGAALLSPMMEATSIVLAGAILIMAGVYQWTPWKQACLRHCRSPLEFVMTQWREGRRGAFVMGLRHGAYCVGCCWMLMLLLFVGGVMNLAWIAGLAAYVLLEKLAPAGPWVGRVAGLLLIGWGIATLFALPLAS